jgi:hypothetical protein
MAHTCNPSYSKGRDQEECSSKPASSRDPILKVPNYSKRADGVAQGAGLEFKPQNQKQTKKPKQSRNSPNVHE